MSCTQTVEGRQTEFEFFQQMQNNRPITSCCGPIVEVGFTHASLSVLTHGLAAIGMSDDYLDFFDPHMLDSSHMSLTMCSRHWAEHCTAVFGIADKLNNDNWKHVSFHIFQVFCLSNEWDYKEVINYFRNIISAKN